MLQLLSPFTLHACLIDVCSWRAALLSMEEQYILERALLALETCVFERQGQHRQAAEKDALAAAQLRLRHSSVQIERLESSNLRVLWIRIGLRLGERRSGAVGASL
eukprot:3282275-Prymnesium_polylepis.1